MLPSSDEVQHSPERMAGGAGRSVGVVPRARVEAFLARTLLFLLSATLALVAVEMVGRRLLSARSPIEEEFPVQHYRRPRPYVMFSGQPSAPGLNERGYRGPAPSGAKPAGEYRVFVLGGSTVLKGRPPFTRFLEERFARAGMADVRVYNFGVMSSVSGMELAKIVFELSDLHPDLIVMYGGGNDFLEAENWDPRPGYPFNFVAYESNPLLESTPSAYPALALGAYASVWLRRLIPGYFTDAFIDLEGLRRRAGYHSLEWQRQIADAYVANVVKAHRVSTAFGSEFIAFYQPLIYFKNPLTTEERGLSNPPTGQLAREVRSMVEERLAKARGNGVRVVDLSRMFADDPRPVFRDEIHTRQEVLPEIADRVYDGIEREVMHKR